MAIEGSFATIIASTSYEMRELSNKVCSIFYIAFIICGLSLKRDISKKKCLVKDVVARKVQYIKRKITEKQIDMCHYISDTFLYPLCF